MYDEGSKKTAMQVAMLVERLGRLSESLDARLRQTLQQQQQTVQALPGIVRKSADDMLSHVAQDAALTVRSGLSQPLTDVARQAAEHQQHMRASVDAMTAAQRGVMRRMTTVTWTAVVLLAVVVPVVVAAACLTWHYTHVISQQRIEARLLRAYNQADVRLCGNQLCARVDRADKRYGEFVPVKPR